MTYGLPLPNHRVVVHRDDKEVLAGKVTRVRPPDTFYFETAGGLEYGVKLGGQERVTWAYKDVLEVNGGKDIIPEPPDGFTSAGLSGDFPDIGRLVEFCAPFGYLTRATVDGVEPMVTLTTAGSLRYAVDRDQFVWRYVDQETIVNDIITHAQETRVVDSEHASDARTQVNIRYECGWNVSVSTPLKPGQSMLRQSALTDMLISMADELHTQQCADCRSIREKEGE